MSTRYKELEAISYKGARQLQDAVQNVESQIQNVSNMAPIVLSLKNEV